MKIDSFAVNMASTSTSVKVTSVQEQAILKIQQFPARELADMMDRSAENGGGQGNKGADFLTLSQEAQAKASGERSPDNAHVHGAKTRDTGSLRELASFPDKDQLKIMMIEQMLKSITGKSYKFSRFDMRQMGGNGQAPAAPQLPQGMPVQGMPVYKPAAYFQQVQMAAMNRVEISAERTQTYYESQSMSFQASGVVNTSDGRQINFDLNILANYEFSSASSVSSSVSAAAGGLRLQDPLVINFDGTLPEFTKDRYAFDITLDGDLENIFMPTNGSGFLALDKNGNGEIDDGGELFGAKTGDGFGELAAYDADGNGWIDEGDGVFENLKIMFADRETGEFMLLTLKEAGVGAIFLGSAASNYEIKADNNETAGIVRKSGIFLGENGNAGSVHHIDLTY